MKRKLLDPRTPTLVLKTDVTPYRSSFASVLKVSIIQANKKRSGAHFAMMVEPQASAEVVADALDEVADMIRKNIRKRAKR